MPEHRYEKADLIERFEGIREKTLGEIDNIGLFDHVQEFDLQKGIAGAVIEQCVLGYEPDTRQEADLIVVDADAETRTELKTTGMLWKERSGDEPAHFVAKEYLSVTAVGVPDLPQQTFESSHFFEKVEHLLLVYYHYLYGRNERISPYDYRDFPVKGYDFHDMTADELQALRADWEKVHTLASEVVASAPGVHGTREWKNAVKTEYIRRHGELRETGNGLQLIDLAPTYPPRFRLKAQFVSSLIAKRFGYERTQLPGHYAAMSDIDRKCHEITEQYGGKTIEEIAQLLNLSIDGDGGKSITEKLIIKMFGGSSGKLNNIDIFRRFGVVAKTVAVTPAGGRTEDMKLFHINFNSWMQEENYDESELNGYLLDTHFLCIIFEEPSAEYIVDAETNKKKKKKVPLKSNKFIGFKRFVIPDSMIEIQGERLWNDTRNKITDHTLIDVPTLRRGKQVVLKSGELSSAPNWMKSSESPIFIRGSAAQSTSKDKTECVNGIRMLPQYVWLSGTYITEKLRETDLL